jgi:hypothetical protein
MSSISCPRRHDGRASPCHVLCMPPAKKTPKVRWGGAIYVSSSVDVVSLNSPIKIGRRLDFHNPTPTFNDLLTLRNSHTLQSLFAIILLGDKCVSSSPFVRTFRHLREFRQQTPFFVYYKVTKQVSATKKRTFQDVQRLHSSPANSAIFLNLLPNNHLQS